MQIVHQSALSSYSLIPPNPLLAAPPVYLALPAPRISGLICAPKPTIIVERYTELDDLIEGLRSMEERHDAELEALLEEGREQRYQLREYLEARMIEKRRQRKQAELDRIERYP